MLGNRYPVLGNRYPVLGNRYPVLGNRYPALGNRYPALRNRYPALGKHNFNTLYFINLKNLSRFLLFMYQSIYLPALVSLKNVLSRWTNRMSYVKKDQDADSTGKNG